jgi:hypothetical protein
MSAVSSRTRSPRQEGRGDRALPERPLTLRPAAIPSSSGTLTAAFAMPSPESAVADHGQR